MNYRRDTQRNTEEDRKRVARLVMENKVPKAEIARMAGVSRHYVSRVQAEIQAEKKRR